MARSFLTGTTDHISAAAAAAINSLDDCTVIMWVQPKVLSGTGQRFFYKGNVQAWVGDPAGGTDTFRYFKARASTDTDVRPADSSLTVDEWTFVGISDPDGGTCRVLLGNLTTIAVEPSYAARTSGAGAATDDSASALEIGGRSGGAESQCHIAHFLLYDRALSVEQMVAHQFDPSYRSPDGNPVLAYNFDMDDGTSLTDLSGNDLAGTLVSSPPLVDGVPLPTPFGIDAIARRWVPHPAPPGSGGPGLNFAAAGTAKVACGTLGSWNPTAGFTVWAWVRLSDLTSNSAIFYKGDDVRAFFDGSLTGELNGIWDGSSQMKYTTTDFGAVVDKWYFVAVTIDTTAGAGSKVTAHRGSLTEEPVALTMSVTAEGSTPISVAAREWFWGARLSNNVNFSGDLATCIVVPGVATLADTKRVWMDAKAAFGFAQPKVLHFLGHNGTGAQTDYSGSGATGTPTAAVVVAVSAPPLPMPFGIDAVSRRWVPHPEGLGVGPGLVFTENKSQGVNHGSGASLDDLDGVTYMAWVRELPLGSVHHGVIGKKTASDQGLVFAIPGNRTLICERQTTGGVWMLCSADLADFAAHDDDEWIMVVATFEMGVAPTLFIGNVSTPPAEPSSYNTQQVGTGSLVTDAAQDFYVGWVREIAARNMNGTIHSTHVVDRILNLEEITGQWASGFHHLGADTKLLCRYGVNGLGVTQKDHSGNANHGTIVDGTGTVTLGENAPGLPMPFGADTNQNLFSYLQILARFARRVFGRVTNGF